MSCFVEHLSLSEYAAEDVAGKYIIGGMFSEKVYLPAKPEVWPTFYIALIVIPLRAKFDMTMRIVRPDGRYLIDYATRYESDADPDPRERLAAVFQIPPLRFTGFGTYVFQVGGDANTVLERKYDVALQSQITPIPFGKLTNIRAVNDDGV